MPLQSGDYVHVRLRVVDAKPDSDVIIGEGSDGNVYFAPSADIIHVELPPITVGDEVRLTLFKLRNARGFRTATRPDCPRPCLTSD